MRATRAAASTCRACKDNREITDYGITASTISSNTAVTQGGGVYLAGTNYRPGSGVPPHVNFDAEHDQRQHRRDGRRPLCAGGPLGPNEELVRAFLYFTTVAANRATTAGGGVHNGGLLMLAQPTEGTNWSGREHPPRRQQRPDRPRRGQRHHQRRL